jgi:hypothetical protein
MTSAGVSVPIGTRQLPCAPSLVTVKYTRPVPNGWE